MGKYCAVGFYLQTDSKIRNNIIQKNKQHHRNVPVAEELTIYLNGHTLVFHSQTQKLEPPCTAY